MLRVSSYLTPVFAITAIFLISFLNYVEPSRNSSQYMGTALILFGGFVQLYFFFLSRKYIHLELKTGRTEIDTIDVDAVFDPDEVELKPLKLLISGWLALIFALGHFFFFGLLIFTSGLSFRNGPSDYYFWVSLIVWITQIAAPFAIYYDLKILLSRFLKSPS